MSELKINQGIKKLSS